MVAPLLYDSEHVWTHGFSSSIVQVPELGWITRRSFKECLVLVSPPLLGFHGGGGSEEGNRSRCGVRARVSTRPDLWG